MIFADTPLAQTLGAMLAHGQLVGDVRWSKGRMLNEADIAMAEAAGLSSLTVARLEPGDVPENAAASQLAARLAGTGIRALPATHGRCNLAATTDGVLTFDPAAIEAINRCDEALTVGTLMPVTRVAAGEIIATVKTIRYAVAGAALERAKAAAQPISVHPFRPLEAALLATELAGTSAKAEAKTVRVTRARMASLGCTLKALPPVAHEIEPLARAMQASDADMLLVVGASASVDRGDVIPAAIIAAGGEVIRLGMPVDPGNLLVLGRLNGRPVIGLPGCARSPKRNGLDIVLERLVAGLDVTADDIAMMGVGGLLPEAERPDPQPRRAIG